MTRIGAGADPAGASSVVSTEVSAVWRKGPLAAFALLSIVLGLGLPGQSALAQTLRATPPDDYGPFYPPDWSGEIDADLRTFSGKLAEGSVLTIGGAVRDTRQRPVPDAVVEIWQADARGRYRHPGVPEQYRDPAFQGYGRVLTDAGGRYGFTTIFPGRYGGRPPHVHIRVAAKGSQEFVTQIYFQGDNREGGPAGRLPAGREALTVDVAKNPSGPWAARFDIVIPDR